VRLLAFVPCLLELRFAARYVRAEPACVVRVLSPAYSNLFRLEDSMAQAQRKLVYHIATSIDGCIARADGSFDFFPSEGDHIPDYIASLQAYGAVIMGRKTYEIGLDQGVTDPYPFLDTYVISASFGPSRDPRVTIWTASAQQLVTQLKQQAGKPIYLCGGAALAGALFADGMVDQLVVKQNPVLLGGGIPLVSALPKHVPLRLSAEKRYQSGVVLLSYDVLG
jgi:dihydrofolate reductase